MTGIIVFLMGCVDVLATQWAASHYGWLVSTWVFLSIATCAVLIHVAGSFHISIVRRHR